MNFQCSIFFVIFSFALQASESPTVIIVQEHRVCHYNLRGTALLSFWKKHCPHTRIVTYQTFQEIEKYCFCYNACNDEKKQFIEQELSVIVHQYQMIVGKALPYLLREQDPVLKNNTKFHVFLKIRLLQDLLLNNNYQALLPHNYQELKNDFLEKNWR